MRILLGSLYLLMLHTLRFKPGADPVRSATGLGSAYLKYPLAGTNAVEKSESSCCWLGIQSTFHELLDPLNTGKIFGFGLQNARP
jgi:hypothetical protein